MSESTNINPVEIKDFLGRHPFTAYIERPKSEYELIESVRRGSYVEGGIRALGTNYSLSEVAVTDGQRGLVISTSELNKHLSHPYVPGKAVRLSPDRIRGKGRGIFNMMPSELARQKRCFVHVEAGITISQLLKDLEQHGLALETMGAGGAQSLAGAISTSTHGGDFQFSTLGESVMAIQLINPLGRRCWILPRGSYFERPEMNQGEYVFHDDKMFHAAKVSMGRLGVIYAVVLEVVPAYGLVEINEKEQWKDVVKLLKRKKTYEGGLFSAALDLEKLKSNQDDWEAMPKGQIKSREYCSKSSPIKLRHLNIAINLANPGECWVTRRWKIESNDLLPAHEAWRTDKPGPIMSALRGLTECDEERNLFRFMLDKQKREKLYQEITGDTFKDARKAQVVRKVLDKIVQHLIRSPDPDHFQISTVLSEALPVGNDWMASFCYDDIEEIRGWSAFIDVIVRQMARSFQPRYESYRRGVYERLVPFFMLIVREIVWPKAAGVNPKDTPWGKINAQLDNYKTAIFEKIITPGREKALLKFQSAKPEEWTKKREARAAYRMWDTLFKILADKENWPAVHGAKLSALVGSILMQFGEFNEPIRVGQATQLLDTHNYSMDGHTNANSAEFFFNFADRKYLDFIQGVIDAAEDAASRPVFGYIGVRFMRKAESLLAMQRFERTVSVEVTPLRAEESDLFSEFRETVFDLAISYNAIPHWGQEFGPQRGDNAFKDVLPLIYGDNLKKWKMCRKELDSLDRFKTNFTSNCGLEGRP